jgi:hypothetical protein
MKRIMIITLLLACYAVGSAAGSGGWTPFRPVKDEFGATILDCSRWIEAPTGRHGFVTVRGERFVFEDGTPVRFWGAQIDLWKKEQADYAIRRMRKQGINITRQHGLGFLNARGGKTSLDFRAEGFDRLDYFISKLVENGIYLILDPHYPLIFRYKAGDSIPGLPEGGAASKAHFINKRAAALMQRRMVEIVTHFNPYTKKRYCDDPTIAMIEILNEESLFWGEIEKPFLSELEAGFSEWLRARYGDDAGLRRAWTSGEGNPLDEGEGLGPGLKMGLIASWDFNEGFFGEHPERRLRGRDQMRFYVELEEKYWTSCRDMLRKAGVKVPINATNWQGHGFTTRPHMLGQSKLDYIDRHGYWDHPQGEGDLKWQISTALFHDLPMVKAVQPGQDMLHYLGIGNLVTEKAWEQVLGLPMTISEWNTCLPNEYSLEGTGLMAAYGLLQGWDASLQFGYFSPDWTDGLGNGSFDMLGNPPQILQYPAVSTLWHRGDVAEAELTAESLYDEDGVFSLVEDRKPVPIAAALVGKVGYRFVEQKRTAVAEGLGPFWDAGKRIARSLTGELTWDAANGVVRINTSRTQAVIGFLSAGAHVMDDVRLESPTGFGVVYVTSMDGTAAIRDARSLLVPAVGPARNSGMEYEATAQKSQFDGPFWHLKTVGTSPALIEAVTGSMRIRTGSAGKMKAWTLDAVGNRMRDVPIERVKDGIRLELKAEYETVYYELSF